MRAVLLTVEDTNGDGINSLQEVREYQQLLRDDEATIPIPPYRIVKPSEFGCKTPEDLMSNTEFVREVCLEWTHWQIIDIEQPAKIKTGVVYSQMGVYKNEEQ